MYLPDAEDVFTVLFEYCRVSDSNLDWILDNLIPNKLTSGFGNIWRRIVTSLAQVMNCQTSQALKFNTIIYISLMESSDRSVVRKLASRQCGPGSISAWCNIWVELIIGSHLALTSFPLSTKTNISKFQFDQRRGPS